MINPRSFKITRPIKAAAAAALCCSALALSPVSAHADDFGLDINLGLKKKIIKGLSASIEGSIRTQDNSSELERLSIGPGIDYKPIKYLKLDLGYEFIDKYRPSYTTNNDNIVESYWSPRHRIVASVSGILPLGDFKISLRERYQYTYRQETSAKKTSQSGAAKSDKIVSAEHSHMWRQRLSFEYEHPDIHIAPHFDFEMYNNLADGFAFDKLRFLLGIEYEITKNHSVELYYRYTYEIADSSEENSHLLGLGYEFTF